MSDFVDGVRPKDSLEAPSAVPLLAPYSVNEESFKQQMATFDRMRETERAFREAAKAKAGPGYPAGLIDLTRLTRR